MVVLSLTFDECLNALTTTTALVKVTAFFLAWGILWFPLLVPVAILVKWRPPQPLKEKQKLSLVASLYLIAPLIIAASAWTEGASFQDYGLSWHKSIFTSLGFGFILGIFSLVVTFGGEWLLGLLQWRWENLKRLPSLLFPLLLVGLWIGITEELIFRGFIINELQQDYNLIFAAVISSLIFALLHLVWEQKDTLPQVPGLWLMGIILVLARWVDGGSLGIAWGLHASWIWGLSCLDSAELISYTGKRGQWLTGVGDKPLAGIAGIFCLLVVGFCLFLY
ncbi:MAG: CPBP family glutamic-type intramembrane protease [Spirulinaceae cyanobacterium]